MSWINERAIRWTLQTTYQDIIDKLSVRGQVVCKLVENEICGNAVELKIGLEDKPFMIKLFPYRDAFLVSWLGGVAECKEINVHEELGGWGIELVDSIVNVRQWLIP